MKNTKKSILPVDSVKWNVVTKVSHVWVALMVPDFSSFTVCSVEFSGKYKMKILQSKEKKN